MQDLTLGKIVDYPQSYDPSVLQAVPRALSRDQIGLDSEALPFTGVDTWNAYEVSWLNHKGKPVVAILVCHVPITSPNLIESKSFKLYLNSFNQSTFDSQDAILAHMQHDLSACAGKPVKLELISQADFARQRIGDFDGILLDELDIDCRAQASVQTNTLQTSDEFVSETLVSHLLKSNCLITNQPDWGSLLIKYQGNKIQHEGLLQYIVSFRQHNEFHEQCVERIFNDLLTHCHPKALSVYARYTRRGGLDINPFRSNFEAPYANIRLARQ